MMGRKFTKGKGSTVHNKERYLIDVPDINAYNSNKELLFRLFKKSEEMADKHWDKRLQIAYSISGRRQSFFNSHSLGVIDDFEKVEGLCQEYLGSDYTYDV